MKNKENKQFDAVDMMREIRKKLVDDYLSNPGKEEQELERIRKEYGFKKRQIKSV